MKIHIEEFCVTILVCFVFVSSLSGLLYQVNTQAASNILDCSDRNNSKYYVVVVQVILMIPVE